MKNKIILLSMLFIGSGLYAQSISLKGKIIDLNEKLPVENVHISISQAHLATSNSSGDFFFDKLQAGTFSLKISHINYKTEDIILNVYSDTSIVIYIKPKSYLLKEITVTSSKYEQNSDDLSYSASFVSKDKINEVPATSVPELLQYEPGVTIERDGIWGADVNIRGLSRSNIVTLVDGDRIETATDLSARLSLIDENDIERIEVIKGAASTLYGTGATGGIINVITKSGNYQDNFYLDGTYYGGYNSVNNYFSNGLTMYSGAENWNAKITATARKANDVYTPAGVLQNSQFQDYGVSSLLQFKTFADQEAKFEYQQFKAQDVGVSGAYPVFTNSATVTYPVETRELISGEYLFNNISETLDKLSIKYFHQFVFRDVENIPYVIQDIPGTNGQPNKQVSVLEVEPQADHNTDSFQSQANFTLSNTNFLIAGVDFWKRSYTGIRDNYQQIQMLNPFNDSVLQTINRTTVDKPLPDARFNSAGIYAQDDIHLLDNKMDVTLGSRYDFIWISNDKTLSPLYQINNGVINYSPAGQVVLWNAQKDQNKSYTYSLGVLYSLANNLNLTFNAAHSFRSPSLEERYQDVNQGNVISLGNPDLEPEKGYFLDAGLRLHQDDFRIGVSIFSNFMTDLVSQIQSAPDTLVMINVGKAFLYGFDVDADYNPFGSLVWYGKISYVRGRDTKDETDLSEIPPLNGIFGVKYNIFGHAELDFLAVVFDAQNRVAPSEQPTPGYAYYNIYVNSERYRVSDFDLSISTGVENIFNKEYRNHLSTSRGFYSCEPGRNFFLKANLFL
ncbi:MAG: TonB-dependent receptor [Ignavibacteriaceae bacterium]